MGNVKLVGPNEGIVKSGTLKRKSLKKIVTGGWLLNTASSNWMKIPLSLFTLLPMCEDAETAEGVQLNVSGAAHVKVKRELIELAAEHWGGQKLEHIKAAMEATIEGHFRSILTSLTVQEAYQNRLKFARLVREEAEQDLLQMGFTIISFVILDLSDDVGYFTALGKPIIAAVKRDAIIAVAEANRDACKSEFECSKAVKEAQLKNEEKVEKNRRNFLVAWYEFQTDLQAVKAIADLAYTRSATKMMREIKRNEKEIEIIERRKQVEIENFEVEKKTLELKTMKNLFADAESYRIQTIAEAVNKCKILLERTEREKKRTMGIPRSVVRVSIGNAHTERHRLRTEVFKKYGPTAVASQVLDVLPKIAAAVSQPLGTIKEITLIDKDTLATIDAFHKNLKSTT